jgi:hypothetical protein
MLRCIAPASLIASRFAFALALETLQGSVSMYAGPHATPHYACRFLLCMKSSKRLLKGDISMVLTARPICISVHVSAAVK